MTHLWLDSPRRGEGKNPNKQNEKAEVTTDATEIQKNIDYYQ